MTPFRRAAMRNTCSLVIGALLAPAILLGLLSGVVAAAPPLTEFIEVAPDGWSFRGAVTHQAFVPFGVNYYDPATYHALPFAAFDVIGGFDSVRVDRHFGQMQGLGVNVARVFLSHVKFLPGPYSPDLAAFAKLGKLIAIARNHGIRLVLDLFDDWEGTPSWESYDMYGDGPTLIQYEYLLNQMGLRYRDEPVILAWNIKNEPSVRGPESGIMAADFGSWVRLKYETAAALAAAWPDYPKTGEAFGNILPPTYAEFIDQESPGNPRFADFQRFREDIAYNWVRRLAGALRSADPNHLVTLGLDPHSAPFKTNGTYYKPYTGFNPRKVGNLLGYTSVHEYNWWDSNKDAFAQGILRYVWTPGRPVVLEEYDLSEHGGSVAGMANAASGFLMWAAYDSPLAWSNVLFDGSENPTAIGNTFQALAASIADQPLVRAADAATVPLDLPNAISARSVQQSIYDSYIAAVPGAGGPVGFEVGGYRAPSLIRVTQPLANSEWYSPLTMTISWSRPWTILYAIRVDVRLSRDGGATWETLVSRFGSSPFSWPVSGPPSPNCVVRVVDSDDGAVMGQSPTFAVTDRTPPLLNVTAPAGGEMWAIGTSQDVRWNATDNVGVDSVNVDYSVHGAAGPWTALAHSLPNSGAFTWTIVGPPTDSAMVRVIAFDHALNSSSRTSGGLFVTGYVGVNKPHSQMWALDPPSPNPARGTLQIHFSVPSSEPALLEVIDVAGRRVESFEAPRMTPGAHTISIHRTLPTGLYVLRLTQSGRSLSTRAVVLR